MAPYITLHARSVFMPTQSDIQSSSDTPPILAIIGRTIPSKSQVGLKNGEVLYLRWRLTSICDKINQFEPPAPPNLSVSRHSCHSLNKEHGCLNEPGLIKIRRRLSRRCVF